MSKIADSAADASGLALPPELFPFIADALAAKGHTKTLLRLLVSSRQIHMLCMPSLMREIHLSWRYSGFVDEDTFS
jgi:hypothetical protein